MNKRLESMIFNKFIYKFFILIIFLSIAYSTSYQQFRYFDINNPRGITDTRIYIKMAEGDYGVSPTHKFRFLIPKTVSILKPLFGNINSTNINNINESKSNENLKLRFWIVNIGLTTLTAYLLYNFQKLIGLNEIGSFLGSLIFLTSRNTIVNTGVPLVDAGQNFAIILLVYFMQLKDSLKISFALPLIILMKETLYPLVFITLLKKNFRNYSVIISLAISISLVIISRHYISNISEVSVEYDISLYDNFKIHSGKLLNNLTDFSFRKIHNLIFYSFSFFTFAALIGFFINLKERVIKIDKEVFLLIPYCMIISVLVLSPGKIIFMTFPIIIPYSVIFLLKIFSIEFNKFKEI